MSIHGGADPDGNQPGDLYVVIKVREDPTFRREGPKTSVTFMNQGCHEQIFQKKKNKMVTSHSTNNLSYFHESEKR
ncbi:chaperone protein DnaJ [Artemisia annua]|uniref:Chaperone protein DnaJ n=1 Tax=Artemisia annua TaxID=35608 RepID=A0A2U1MWM6_ARTAN|nr:chaperone protein DnaJ [Artemisia annua]